MPRNLLVVDDSATIRDAVRYALVGEDWNVVTAADTAEALEAVGEGAIDAVLCDASLAPDDGYDACRALRSAMGDEPVPIVLMGGKVSENLAASAGATAVLTKPFESEELLELLRAEVEERSFDLPSEDFGSAEDDALESDMAEQALPAGEQDLDLGLLGDFAPAREREILEASPASGAPAEKPPFDLTSQDFTLVEDDEALEPAAAGAGVVIEDEVEVIDLSDDEDAEALELIQDLEPVAAGPASRWESEDRVRPLDLNEEVEIEEIDTGLRHGGAVEFDLADLGGEETEEEEPTGSEEEPAFGETSTDVVDLGLGEASDRDRRGTLSEAAPRAASDGWVDTDRGAPDDLDLDDLDLELELEPASPAPFGTAGDFPTAPPRPAKEMEPPAEADDLLEDIDLEGWAEETAPAPAATASEAGPRWTGSGGEGDAFSSDDTISEEEGAEEALPLDEEAELAIEDEDEPPLKAQPEPALETEPLPVAAAEEPLEGENLEDWSQFEESGVGEEEPEAPSIDEEILAAVQSSPLEAEFELEGLEEPEELPPAAAAEAVETDATWAEPPPAPSGGAAWDLEPLPPEPLEGPREEPRTETLAEPVARAAEEAVRQALAESLSPQALTPVVEAVVERVVWEVVPQLAERLIREAIERLQQEPAAD